MTTMTNRYELAVDGLRISIGEHAVLVRDGQTSWIGERWAWDEIRQRLEARAADDAADEAGMHAYGELCADMDGTVAIINGGGSQQGTRAERDALVRLAVDDGLIEQDEAHMY